MKTLIRRFSPTACDSCVNDSCGGTGSPGGLAGAVAGLEAEHASEAASDAASAPDRQGEITIPLVAVSRVLVVVVRLRLLRRRRLGGLHDRHEGSEVLAPHGLVELADGAVRVAELLLRVREARRE